jgi:hypothetical protein
MQKLERAEYRVVAVDTDGYWISAHVTGPLKAAKADAKAMLECPDLISAGIYKAEVLNGKDECVFDVFGPCPCEDTSAYLYSGVPGILAHIDPATGKAVGAVQRCDLCCRFRYDEDAQDNLKKLGIL